MTNTSYVFGSMTNEIYLAVSHNKGVAGYKAFTSYSMMKHYTKNCT